MAKGTVVDRLLVEIRAETAQLQKDLKKMEGQLSKAEKKKLEDEEFERVMKEMGGADTKQQVE